MEQDSNLKLRTILPLSQHFLEPLIDEQIPSTTYTYKSQSLQRENGCNATSQGRSGSFMTPKLSSLIVVVIMIIISKRSLSSPPDMSVCLMRSENSTP